MHLVAGIDEAGRGPMLGPMVVALVALNNEKIRGLVELGVRDSKTISPKRREKLAKIIRDIAEHVEVRIVEPQEIDRAVRGESARNLNDLEAKIVAELIFRVINSSIEVFLVDSPDPNPARFAEKIMRHLWEALDKEIDINIVAENNADKKYPVVSAASIVAKVTRDKIINELKEKYGDFGSGYPSDPRTRRYAREWLRKHKEPPPFARKSWQSWRKISKGI